MKFLQRCNGYSSQQNDFSLGTITLMKNTLRAARILFEEVHNSGELKEHGEFYRGIRFDSDESALERISSQATEDEFRQNPMGWCLDALRDCASADHWYAFEKEWD